MIITCTHIAYIMHQPPEIKITTMTERVINATRLFRNRENNLEIEVALEVLGQPIAEGQTIDVKVELNGTRLSTEMLTGSCALFNIIMQTST